MNIFLAGIMQGSKVAAEIHEQGWREPITRIVERHLPSAEVYCHFSRHPDSIGYGLQEIRTTMTEGLVRAAACDLLIAYIPSASMGTAIEMYDAAKAGAIVLTISPLQANWVIRAYSDRVFPDVEAFEQFLAAGKLAQLLKAKDKLPKAYRR